MRTRLIALGISLVLMAVAGAAPAFAQNAAEQSADNAAESQASNDADVTQTGAQTQSSDYQGSLGAGGPGQFQAGVQNAEVNQTATSGDATANQEAINANVPIALFGNITSPMLV